MPVDLTKTTLDLIRHGEPVGGRRYRGQIDDPLSDKGWAQMRAAVGDHCPWTKIYSSTLRRCSEFAHELARRHSLPLVCDTRLMEIGFGAWEGRTVEELERDDPDRVRNFWDDPVRYRPAGAESLVDFHRRIVSVWSELCADNVGLHILVVAHAGVMRMILAHILDMPMERLFRIQVANACITRIQLEATSQGVLPRLVFHDGNLT